MARYKHYDYSQTKKPLFDGAEAEAANLAVASYPLLYDIETMRVATKVGKA